MYIIENHAIHTKGFAIDQNYNNLSSTFPQDNLGHLQYY